MVQLEAIKTRYNQSCSRKVQCTVIKVISEINVRGPRRVLRNNTSQGNKLVGCYNWISYDV